MSCSHSKLWNALIRTHHITSRKKVAKLKQAASAHDVFVLLCSGGPPGIMYVEGSEGGVTEWVAIVQVSDVNEVVKKETLMLGVEAKI